MTTLRNVIDAFRRGDQDEAQLLAAFAASRETDPAEAARMLGELTDLAARGFFPQPLLNTLASLGPAAADGRERANEATVVLTRGAQDGRTDSATPGPTEAPEEKTVVIPSARTAATDRGAAAPPPPAPVSTTDATRVTAPSTTAADATRITSPTGTTGPGTTPSQAPTGTGAATGSASTAGRSSPSGTAQTTRYDYPPLAQEPQEGDLLRNRFKLEKLLGRGGMGVVFKARDLAKAEVDFAKDEQNYVALKLLNDKFKQNPDSIKVLGREFTNTQRLNHPNIIHLYDFDKDDQGNYFIAMELLQGDPLDRLIRDQCRPKGLPFARAFHLVEQMGSALAAAHNHKPPIIHSDFKPGNVYVGAGDHVKVFDFGIARATRSTGGEGDHETTNYDPGSLGALTPAYASLEMLLGEDPDARDDIYALAIVAYELLTGTRPFGRKTTALEARDQSLKPAPIKELNGRQWRGLRRGLAFERTARSQTVEQFIDELRHRPARWPWAVAAGVIGTTTLGWFLGLDPWLDRQQEAALLAEVEATLPAELGTLLARAEALPDQVRGRLTAALAGRLADLIAGADPAAREHALTTTANLPDAVKTQVFERVRELLAPTLTTGAPSEVLQRLAIIEGLPSAVRSGLLAGAADSVRGALITQARAAFDPDAGHYEYTQAQALLTQADRLFPDSKAIFDEQSQLKARYERLLSSLDERITAAREQVAALLPEAGRDSLPALLAILKQVDPGQVPKYAYLANSYYSAAKAAEATDLTAAAGYVAAGLALFPTSSELENQQARIQDLVRGQSQAQALAALQQRVKTALKTVDAAAPTADFLADLRELRTANPQDPLLADAAGRAEKALRPALSALLAARDWTGADALLARYSGMAESGFLTAQSQAVTTAREAFEARIAALETAIQGRLGARDLAAAETLLANLATLDPANESLGRGRSELVRAYLTQAREARTAGRWDAARALVDQALTRASDAGLKDALAQERTAIDDAETASRQEVAATERVRLEAERAARVTALTQEFNTFVATMGTSETEFAQARGLLDRLAGLAPDDPLLETGLTAIAARFTAAAEREDAAGRWEDAIATVRRGQRWLPGIATLDQALERLSARAAAAQTQRQLDAIAAQETAVGQLLDAPDLSPAGAKQLGAAMGELAQRAAADPSRVKPFENRINTLYGQRLDTLGQENRFAEGRALLTQWESLVPGAGQLRQQARAQLEAAFSAWEQAEGERKQLAEIEANKQSLLTQAKADQTDKALATLGLLRDKLGATDPFVSTEAPRVIAEAYVRQAGQSAKRGRNETALKLLDKATGLDPTVAVAGLREQIELNLTRDRFTAQLGSADAAGMANLASPLADLKAAGADDYPRWEQDWIKTLTNRVKAEKNPAAAERLRTAALGLFPDAPALVQVQIQEEPPPPVEPPPSAALDDARALLAANRLTALEQTLAQIPAGQPERRPLEQALTAAKTDAGKAYKLYEQALAQGQFDRAQKALGIARQRWVDNAAWQDTGTVQPTAPGPAAKPAGARQEPCNPKYAGYGNTKKARCADTLSGDAKGPELVVIPPAPGSQQPFAITRYEISVAEFNQYCTTTKECTPIAGRNPKLPISGITASQAEQYAAWLTRLSGFTYRLPTAGEWEVATRAKGESAGGATNCLLRSGSQIVKGGTPDPVGTGANNSWGLVNAVGNVQEWTRDGGTLQVRGGHYAEDASRCSVSLVTGHSGKPDAYTGFRLVKEIGG
ncbi:protein kinase [uncultured Lamprocystis sp.]|jgi:hypothetical protein|uniref:protein kinase domain-containing protein n=1 Tax=uncultured Lamprocystis sp. TaxID=543132 RepID=UPI0025EBA753|nr:protein kinase [uncultured Lamprocystis sp.]